ncbi:MAG: hypothetical protein PHT40_03910 [Patescibacteria group bacterium]|nr:hypothetical protein [Patescibacteria group bacterium]
MESETLSVFNRSIGAVAVEMDIKLEAWKRKNQNVEILHMADALAGNGNNYFAMTRRIDFRVLPKSKFQKQELDAGSHHGKRI